MSSRTQLLLVLAAIFALLLPAGHLIAQTSDTGSVTGTISSAAGKPIPKVEVTLIADSGAERKEVTDANGGFTFTQVPPGDYGIRFSAAGFRTLQITSFTVNVGETPNIARQLQAGQASAAPVVEARAENLPLASAATGTTLNATEATSATRNFTQQTAQAAGSNAALPNATSVGRNDTDISSGGASTGQNAYQMDGVNVVTWSSGGNAAEGGTYATIGTPSPDAIQEVKVDVSGIDAAFGRQPGAHVNVILRSGGSAWHGSMFEFFRNTALNSNEYFRELTCNNNVNLCAGQTTKLNLNQNQFGGVIGGPVKKNKLYVFLSYQQTWQKNGYATGNGGAYSPSVNLPVLETSAGANNYFNAPGSRGTFIDGAPSGAAATAFVNSLGSVYGNMPLITGATNCSGGTPAYPWSGYTAGAGSTGVLCPGLSTNPSYVNNINPVALAYLTAVQPNGQYLMQGSVTGILQNGSYDIPDYFPMYQGIFNFDYYLTRNNVLSGRYSHQDETQKAGFAAGTQGNPMPGAPAQLGFGYTDYLVRVTSIASAHTTNEVRFAWQDHTNIFTSSAPPSLLASNFYSGIPVTTVYGATSIVPGCGMISCAAPNINQAVTFAPVVAITSNYSVGGCPGCDSHFGSPQFEAGDDISWTHGKHSLRFGVEYDRAALRFTYYGTGRGVMSFNDFQDFLVGVQGACGGFVAGVCNGGTASNINSTQNQSYSLGPQGSDRYFSVYGYAGYVQDDFKITKKLTINMGMRWEYNSAFSDLDGNITNVTLGAIQLNPYPVVTSLYQLGTYYGYSVPGTTCVGAAPPAGNNCFAPPAGSTYLGWVESSNANTAYGPPPAGVQNSGKLTVVPNAQPLDNFGPRLGFAFSPLKNNKMVIRAGVGYFYSRNVGSNFGTRANNPPSASLVDCSGGSCAFASEEGPYRTNIIGDFPVRWVNPTAPTTKTYQLSSNLSEGAYGNLTSPLTYAWNFSLQYEIAPTWVVTAAYQGSEGIHQINGQTLPNPANIATAANPITIPGFGGGPSTVITTSTTSNVLLRVPYLGYQAAGIVEIQNDLNYKFNSLALSLNKRLSHGISVNASYTYARPFIQSTSFNSPLNVIYTPNTGYRPQRVIIRYTWNLPGGHLRGVAGKVLGGWSVSGVTTIQDGTPLTFTDNRLGAVYGLNGSSQTLTAQLSGAAGVGLPTGGNITSRLGGSYACLPVNPCPNGYINKAYFVTAAGSLPLYNGIANDTVYGNSGEGILLGPGQFNFDSSLTKTMVVGGLRENARLQFRGEFYNMFNHPQFGNPATAANSAGTLGQITTTSVNPRLIQFGLKYLF